MQSKPVRGLVAQITEKTVTFLGQIRRTPIRAKLELCIIIPRPFYRQALKACSLSKIDDKRSILFRIATRNVLNQEYGLNVRKDKKGVEGDNNV